MSTRFRAVKAYVSRTGTRWNRRLIKACEWAWMVGPLDMGGPVLDGLSHACDNGAWPCFQAYLKGKRPTPMLDLKKFQTCIARHGSTADFIIIPDIVQGGDMSWAMTRYWMRRLRRDRRFKGVMLLIAVQDGMTPDMIRPFLRDKRIGIFVGGSTEWKLATKRMWAALAHEGGPWGEGGNYCHVGRVNTERRIDACGKDGVDGIDGSSGARFAVTILPLNRALRDVVIQRSQMDIETYIKEAA